ncbi:MAG: hypothetical protein FJ286_05095 [Planctomycetes bacterium]|nr:hypothetical protein [Planctomycetota bacterium]
MSSRDAARAKRALMIRHWMLGHAFVALGVAVASSGGCSDGNLRRQVAAMNDSRIKQLANLFRFYQATNGWVGPKDEATLQAFLQSAPTKNLAMMGIDPARFDEMLVSDRDGKPFRVRWGVSIGPLEEQAVVFEAEGSAGKRFVAFTGARAEEVDSDRYDRLWNGEAVTAAVAPAPTPPK